MFAAARATEATVAGGDDTVYDTKRADHLDGRWRRSGVHHPRSREDLLDLGSDFDTLTATLRSTASVDAVSTGATVSIAQHTSGLSSTLPRAEQRCSTSTAAATTTPSSAAGISLSSTIDEVSLSGLAGDDLLIGGPVTHTIYGGTGTNRFEMGSAPSSAAWSESETDTIVVGSPSEAAAGSTTLPACLRSGGRTFEGLGEYYRVVAYANDGDTVARIRPTVGGDLLRTYSLNRPGQRVIPVAGTQRSRSPARVRSPTATWPTSSP
ncbi:MAG: hypothetical protein R2701_11820 [Acidimicrobiales bacterium]